jgi:hypothetical protein
LLNQSSKERSRLAFSVLVRLRMEHVAFQARRTASSRGA